MLYAFRADLEIEYMKRRIPEKDKFILVDKQLRLIFSKIVADLQKEFKIILTEKTISSLNGEKVYALDREFMTFDSAFYGSKKLTLKTLTQISNMTESSGSPDYIAIKQLNSYPYIILHPTPNADGTNIVVKSYNDMKLYSINDGLDSKSNETDETLYMKIPTQYDSAILLGMMAEFFDDKLPKYEREKLRLKGLRFIEGKIDYNMTGIPDTNSYSYNSSVDGTPTVIPSDPS